MASGSEGLRIDEEAVLDIARNGVLVEEAEGVAAVLASMPRGQRGIGSGSGAVALKSRIREFVDAEDQLLRGFSLTMAEMRSALEAAVSRVNASEEEGMHRMAVVAEDFADRVGTRGPSSPPD